MKDKNKIYVTRLILAGIGGIISGIFKFALESAGEAIMLMVLFYLASLYITIYLFKIKPDINSDISVKNIFLEGAGTFVITWLFLWILIYNLLLII